eukprot:TRINITY_DN88536_c0_g1_i1.p1 TRINITY_DN88536_c0_g1~~TRINITY_DN88536_c0_g1_i1.p1  ORF type:complete len:1777 (+),score=234.93 TRINITY_DN88536_c0_g1_i1:51-5333(+)
MEAMDAHLVRGDHRFGRCFTLLRTLGAAAVLSYGPGLARATESGERNVASLSERRLATYDCHAGASNPAGWPDDQKCYCCEFQNVGCDDQHRFDCTAGLANWKAGWSQDKMTWCCAHKNLGCQESGTGSEPFDCDAGFNQWQQDWSDPKKNWCCSNKNKGCAPPTAGYDPLAPAKPGEELYDCQEGLWNFRIDWSRQKKDYCCAHQHLGCEGRPDVTILDDTSGVVAKCAGSEKEFQRCEEEDCNANCQPEDCVFQAWSQWSNLGGCYGLCQRERTIIKVNNACGKPCAGPRVMTQAGGQCQPDDKCHLGIKVDCQWNEWSAWSNTCEHVLVDQSVRWRNVAVEPSLGGLPCLGSFNETRACVHASRKDCEFSQWTAWTQCSESCGGGTKSRLRRIQDFAEHAGKPCDGVLREAQSCGEDACPGTAVCKLTEWSPWSGCTQVIFQQQRSREVESVPQEQPNQEIFCEFMLKETMGCPRGADEPNECKLSDWGEWGACSSGCGGSHSRNRSIEAATIKSCHAKELETLMETRPCGEQGPCKGQACELNEWTKWTECSHRCGPGVTTRDRTVKSGGNCAQVLKEVQGCKVADCVPQDCVWGEWVFWSTCSKTCGSGVKRRHRAVAMAPRHGGKPCTPEDNEEVAICSNNTCSMCVDGEWGEWGPWGKCSSTCAPAYRVRHRDTVTFPNHCGQPALGLEDDYQLCDDAKNCTKNYDCQLSTWSLWSDCSCKCFGVAERSRRISRNAAGNGRPCLGSMKEIEPCNPRQGEKTPEECLNHLTEGDCQISEWESWAPCTATCGGGQMSRLRSIVTPNKPGGVPCNDTLSEVQACGTQACGGRECQDCIWGEWGPWGECSKCGGQRYRHRQVAKMPNYCGRVCDPGAAKEVMQCHSNCGDTHFCVWTSWADASSCSSECGHASKLRQRELQTTEHQPMWGQYLFNATMGFACSGVQVEATLCDYTPCGDADDRSCKPVDCQLGEWSMWGEPSCTQLCERHRTIKVPASCGGKQCQGATVDTKHCVKMDCREVLDCKFSDWHEWTSICIDGQKHRFRVIQRPASNGGDPCCGPTKESEPCDQNRMPSGEVQDAVPTPWQPWSECSLECGGGIRHRKRSIQTEAANGGYPFCGALRQIQPCNEEACGDDKDEGQDCVLSPWGEWGRCQDHNMQYRNRRILHEARRGGKSCETGIRQVRQCREAVDCVISAWTPWTTCTVSCGGGQTTRQRQVTKNPRGGGKDCPRDLVQIMGCHDIPCSPDDAQVSAWTEWSPCDVDCGFGQRQRTREVTSHPKERGIGFYGGLIEVSSCFPQPCGKDAQDCVWGEWTEWTECDIPCGGGQQFRQRHIAKVPRNGGKLCPAEDKDETRPCNTQHCKDGDCIDGVWREWNEWEPCSSTCHGGYTWRTRSPKVEANYCGQAPIGLSLQHQGCNIGVKCNPNQDCVWGSWYDWSQCTAPCFGSKWRARKITQHGRGAGAFCTGPLRQTTPCAEEAGCPHAGEDHPSEDCELSQWSNWGDCDKACGSGQAVRMRQLHRAGSHGGKDCVAELAQTRPCTKGPCSHDCKKTDCLWSEWAQWSACDQCDGQMTRHRVVQQHAACGGKRCESGDAEQVAKCPRFCHAQSYCGWSEWEEWGHCSVSCGIGVRGRTRTLRPSASPPVEPKVLDVPFNCQNGLSNWQQGFSAEKKDWCCKNERVACPPPPLAGGPDVVARFSALKEKTLGLESQRRWHLAGAWVAGSLTLVAGQLLLRVFRRRTPERPLTQGFSQLPTEQ